MTIGFDLGGQNCVTAVTRRGAQKNKQGGNFVDITLDAASKRSVKPFITFPEAQRIFGNGAFGNYKKYLASTVREPQLLLGKSWEEYLALAELPSEVQEINLGTVPIVPSNFTTEAGTQVPAFQVNYLGKDILITPEQATAICLKHALSHVAELGVKTTECCVTIANNCSYAKREAYLAAAEIAGINCYKLVTSTSCLALEYGLLRGKAKGPKVATLFIDVGHSGANVGVVQFFDGGWSIVKIDTFTGLSGESMDRKMLQTFSDKFNAKFNLGGFLDNAKSCAKVEAILHKMKKSLVANEDTAMTIDFLYLEKDFKCEMTRQELWDINAQGLEGFLGFLEHFLETAKAMKQMEGVEFASIELVGGVSRMVDLKARMSEVCGRVIGLPTLMMTLNTDEAVARGCVLQSAIFSPRFAIAKKEVKDIIPYGVFVGRESLNFPLDCWKESSVEKLFSVGNEVGKTKTITFKKPKPFRFILIERTNNDNEEDRLIGWADVDPSANTLDEAKQEKWKRFQLIVDLTPSGLLQFHSEITKSRIELVDVTKEEEVELTEEEYQENLAKAQEAARKKAEEEYKVKKAAEKKAKEEAAAAAAAAETTESTTSEAENVTMAEEPATTEAEDVEMEEAVTIEVPEVTVPRTKKVPKVVQEEKVRLSKITVPVTFVSYMNMTAEARDAIIAQEKEQTLFDKACLEKEAARNLLETYVLEGQDGFSEYGMYGEEVMTEEECENFMEKLMEADDWINDDYDCAYETSVYNEKLQSLQDIGNIFVSRYNEYEKRGPALEKMAKLLIQCEKFCGEERATEAFVHIEDAIVEEFKGKVAEARVWLDERQQLHQTTQKTADPPYYTIEIEDKLKEITLALTAIKAIPKPKPVAEEKTEESKEDAQNTTEETKPAAEETKPAAEEVETNDVEMEV